MTTLTKRETIAAICSNWEHIPERLKKPARDIYGQFVNRGEHGASISDRQWQFLASIAAQTLEIVQGKAAPALQLPGLVSFLDASKLKRPRLFIGEMQVSTAEKDRHTYYVKAGGIYCGKIQGGQFMPRGNLPGEVLELLQTLDADPTAALQRTGIATEHCCYCNDPLTDPKSRVWGYGPTCARNYGLPHGKRAMSAEQLERLARILEQEA